MFLITVLLVGFRLREGNCLESSIEDRVRELENSFKLQQAKIEILEQQNKELSEMLLKYKIGGPMFEGPDTVNMTETSETYDSRSNRTLELLLHGHIKKRSDSRPAFYAYLENSNVCFHENNVMVFDVKVIDIGNGYNTYGGIYRPPVSGIYVFTWTVVATYTEWFVTKLMVNGHVRGVTMADADSSGGTGIHPATGIAIVEVHSGENVYIRRGTTQGCKIASTSQARNTFSGWLLQ